MRFPFLMRCLQWDDSKHTIFRTATTPVVMCLLAFLGRAYRIDDLQHAKKSPAPRQMVSDPRLMEKFGHHVLHANFPFSSTCNATVRQRLVHEMKRDDSRPDSLSKKTTTTTTRPHKGHPRKLSFRQHPSTLYQIMNSPNSQSDDHQQRKEIVPHNNEAEKSRPHERRLEPSPLV